MSTSIPQLQSVQIYDIKGTTRLKIKIRRELRAYDIGRQPDGESDRLSTLWELGTNNGKELKEGTK